MTLPESLPARLYLLAYDTEKNRVTAQSRLGLVLWAAALADLYLAGRVTDENGKARATGDRRPTGDPLLDEVLQQLADHRPRSWQGWIARGQPAVRTVRAQLEAGLCIRVERRRILPDRVELLDRLAVERYADEVLQQLAEHRPRSWQGWIARGQPAVRTVSAQLEAGLCIRVEHRRILPDRVELRDPPAVQRYADELRAELRRPASRTEPRTAAVLAHAARGEISTLISRSERREHRQRLDELAVHTGPIADALRKAWRDRQAQMASG